MQPKNKAAVTTTVQVAVNFVPSPSGALTPGGSKIRDPGNKVGWPFVGQPHYTCTYVFPAMTMKCSVTSLIQSAIL